MQQIHIAVEYGYPEQQSFCRVFKNHYGVSPTTFRKANTPRDELWMSAEKLLVKFKSSDKSIS
ncbi:TPA: AraC family transcriptional regulator [Klebsiella michiganensis]